MAELSLLEEIQLLINIGVDPTVAATTVNNERTRRAPPAPVPAGSNHVITFSASFFGRQIHLKSIIL